MRKFFLCAGEHLISQRKRRQLPLKGKPWLLIVNLPLEGTVAEHSEVG